MATRMAGRNLRNSFSLELVVHSRSGQGDRSAKSYTEPIDRKLGFCGALRAPQNPKSWISEARSASEIQLLEK
jgi:hypothetical protein